MIDIIHGDALEVLQRPEIASQRFDALITDPPYLEGHAIEEYNGTAASWQALAAASKLVDEKGLIIIFTGGPVEIIDRVRDVIAMPLRRVLMWAKPMSRTMSKGPWGWNSYPILVFGKLYGLARALDHIVCEGFGYGRRGVGHPAEIPPEVAGWIYQALSDRTETVLDPFCGTGSLLVPWSQGLGIEKDAKWAEEARRRMRNRRDEDGQGTPLFGTLEGGL